MPSNKQSGFTLIEIIIVMAISAGLFLIIFAGQKQLRERTRFDAAINETVQQIAYTRNYALAGVNPYGNGDLGTSEVAGASFEVDDDHDPGHLGELEPVYSNYDGAGAFQRYADVPSGGNCPEQLDNECYEHYFNTSLPLHVVGAANHKAVIVFINKPTGLLVCGWQGGNWLDIDKVCSSAFNPGLGQPITLRLTDNLGNTADIVVDPNTGDAKRMN
jgi:prepilin-type N-terminal cleavage/methylation domain-containing protein